MEKETLEILLNQGLSLNKISKKLNKSLTTIRYWTDKFNLKSNHPTFKQRKSFNLETNTKVCTKCKLEKDLSFFYKKNKNYSFSFCKECFNQYCSERWVNKKIESIIYKGSKCIDCQISFPEEPYVIFEFHHLNPKDKDFDWSEMRLQKPHIIKEELDKCVLLCSNCHRKRHHQEDMWSHLDSNQDSTL
jgi:hypothetical protein